MVPVQTGGRNHGSCRHGGHYVDVGARGHPDPPNQRRRIVHIVVDGSKLAAGSQDLPPFDLGRALTDWALEPVAFIALVWVAAAYLYGVHLLRARGDRWPLGRTLAFVGGGLGAAAVATLSGVGRYDTTLISVHMVQHMALTMVVPMFCALGAPVTLALRTLPARPRRWLLAVLHSGVAKVLTFPPLTLAVFVVSPWALYFSGWYEASLRSAYVHETTHLHLVLVGSLFFWPLVGIDPVPGRVGYPFRVLMTLLTLPFHAFLGVTIMGTSTVLAGDWYAALRRGPMASWLPPALDDQELAGGILWASGDLIGLVFFLVLFAQWVRSSTKEAAREDRRLDLLEAQAARTRSEGPGDSARPGPGDSARPQPEGPARSE